MSNSEVIVPVVVKEFVHCIKEGKLIGIESCRKCDYHSKYFKLGFNSFIRCKYPQEENK